MVKKANFLKLCSFAVLGLLLFSCNPSKRINKEFNYFQNGLDSSLTSVKYTEPKIAPNDIINIQVIAGSISQQDASVFNLSGSTLMPLTIGPNIQPSTPSNNQGANYQVEKDGFITMPKIGKIKAVGFTKYELGSIITKKIQEGEFVKDPLVVVKLSQFRVNVLGEVKRPGTVFFKNEKTNILEVIAESGDLTEFGKRDDIVVIRQEGEKWITYKINLTKTDFFRSEGFYLKNNDVVYISSNDTKLKMTKVNPNLQKDISIASIAVQGLFFLMQAILVLRSFN